VEGWSFLSHMTVDISNDLGIHSDAYQRISIGEFIVRGSGAMGSDLDVDDKSKAPRASLLLLLLLLLLRV